MAQRIVVIGGGAAVTAVGLSAGAAATFGATAAFAIATGGVGLVVIGAGLLVCVGVEVINYPPEYQMPGTFGGGPGSTPKPLPE